MHCSICAIDIGCFSLMHQRAKQSDRDDKLRFAVTVATRATLSAGFGLAIHSREITLLGT